MKAIWNDVVIAQSDDVLQVEGNYYFPKNALNSDYFEESETTSHCAWKGQANYLNVSIDGKVSQDAAWYYAHPKPDAQEIEGRVAFWKDVEVKAN